MIKKRGKKGFIFARDPRGCDVAHKAMWQSHAGLCKCVRGVEVTHGHYLYLIVIYRVIVHISFSIIER